MVFSRIAYQTLADIVGHDYVSDDPAVTQAYTKNFWFESQFQTEKIWIIIKEDEM